MFEDVVTRYFSRELTERTNELGLRKWYIAYYCETSEKTITECLNGSRLPSVWQLILMAEMCRCSVNDLLGYRYFKAESSELASSIPQAKQRLAVAMWNAINEVLDIRNMQFWQLAERIGVPWRTVGMLLENRNETFPKTIVLIRICDALDCTPSDLLGY